MGGFSKKKRIEVQRETIKHIEKNSRKYKSKSIKYPNYEPRYDKRWGKLNHKTVISVEPTDTLESVVQLINDDYRSKIGFLVMANSTNKGGGYLRGTNGQEESICRRTDLHNCFKGMKYPIPEFGTFFVQGVSIIRETEKEQYKFFEKPYKACCVLSAAYHDPPADKNGRLTDGYRTKTKHKLEAVLNTFLEESCYNIVLGAYGCGAFGNPVKDIALIFKELLESDKYKNTFQKVVFAVLKEAGGNNYNAFREIFK